MGHPGQKDLFKICKDRVHVLDGCDQAVGSFKEDQRVRLPFQTRQFFSPFPWFGREKTEEEKFFRPQPRRR